MSLVVFPLNARYLLLLYLLSAEFQLDETRYFIVVVVVAGVALTATP